MNLKPIWLLHDTLISAVRKFPDKTAFIIEDEKYSYETVYNDVCRLASALINFGLKQNDRVVIYLDNTYTNIVSFYATLMAGGAFIIVNPQTKSDKLEYIINNSEAGIFISDSHLFSKIQPITQKCNKIHSFIYSISEPFSKLPIKGNCIITEFSKLLSDTEPLSKPVLTIPNNLAALIYTSGSTGNPKGVMMSHRAMLFAAQSVSHYLRLDASHIFINALPLAFDYGLYQVLMSVVHCATLVLERSFTYPAQILNKITEHSVTVFPGVPTIYATLIGMHRRKLLFFPSVTRISNTAAALPPDYTKELHEIFPNALIYRMYGLTECKRVCYLEPELADQKPTSVGKAIPGTEIKVLDVNGRECGPNETGLLYVRGPHIMMGYWKAPDLSQKMLKPGKFPGEQMLCTNDWFKMDTDGDLYFIGRTDDIIKSRGEKVSPVEVENVLIAINGVCEAAVIGVEDNLLGQAIKAFVALDDQTISKQMIKKYCTDHLENFMVPKYIEIVPELPKTPSGKITKKTLK